MKTLLAIGVVCFCAQLSTCNIFMKCGLPEEYHEQASANHYNLEVRKKYAEKHQIANMHELKYDRLLHIQGSKMNSCDDLKHGPNYRIAPMPFENEFYHPLQTTFAYCKLAGVCERRVMVKNGNGSWVRFLDSEIYFIGTKGTFSESDIIHGPPGSQCPLGKAESGLCRAEPGPTQNPAPQPQPQPQPESQTEPQPEPDSVTTPTLVISFLVLMVLLV